MLSDNIKNLRTEKGLSQESLAQKLNVVRQTVSKWENGTSVPDAYMLANIAKFLGTTPDELLGTNISNSQITDCKLEEELAAITIPSEKRHEIHRRFWRIISVIVLIIAAVGIITTLLPFLHHLFANLSLTESVSIIGGADGPTAIYVSSKPVMALPIIAIVLLVASIAGIILTKRKRK